MAEWVSTLYFGTGHDYGGDGGAGSSGGGGETGSGSCQKYGKIGSIFLGIGCAIFTAVVVLAVIFSDGIDLLFIGEEAVPLTICWAGAV